MVQGTRTFIQETIQPIIQWDKIIGHQNREVCCHKTEPATVLQQALSVATPPPDPHAGRPRWTRRGARGRCRALPGRHHPAPASLPAPPAHPPGGGGPLSLDSQRLDPLFGVVEKPRLKTRQRSKGRARCRLPSVRARRARRRPARSPPPRAGPRPPTCRGGPAAAESAATAWAAGARAPRRARGGGRRAGERPASRPLPCRRVPHHVVDTSGRRRRPRPGWARGPGGARPGPGRACGAPRPRRATPPLRFLPGCRGGADVGAGGRPLASSSLLLRLRSSPAP